MDLLTFVRIRRNTCHLIVLNDFVVSSQQKAKVVKFSSLSDNITLFIIFHESLVRSQLVSLEFFIEIKSFQSHYGPGVDSASNRNEYQEHFLRVKAAGE